MPPRGKWSSNNSSNSERFRRNGAVNRHEAFGDTPDDLRLRLAGDPQRQHAAPGTADVSLSEDARRADPGDPGDPFAAVHRFISKHHPSFRTASGTQPVGNREQDPGAQPAA